MPYYPPPPPPSGTADSLAAVAALATDPILDVRVTGDADRRFFMQADGTMEWGNGTDPWDTIVGRGGDGGLVLQSSAGAVVANGVPLDITADITVGALTGGTHRTVSAQLKAGGSALGAQRALWCYYSNGGGTPIYNSSSGEAIVTGTVLQGLNNPASPEGKPYDITINWSTFLFMVLTDVTGLLEIDVYGAGETVKLNVILPDGSIAASPDAVFP